MAGRIAAMTLDLSPDEQRLLLETLQNEVRDLKAEINRTETTSFREELKTREAMLMAIIGRLENPPA
jgi:hypothetical protein